jgi:flagellar basal-body rod protein FlgB
MDSSTAVLMIKALDCLQARQVATAENIANANTPGYRPLRVSFEQALSDAAQQGDAAVAAVTPTVTRSASISRWAPRPARRAVTTRSSTS